MSKNGVVWCGVVAEFESSHARERERERGTHSVSCDLMHFVCSFCRCFCLTDDISRIVEDLHRSAIEKMNRSSDGFQATGWRTPLSPHKHFPMCSTSLGGRLVVLSLTGSYLPSQPWMRSRVASVAPATTVTRRV